jgi:4-diphosphocytidyl-2-C-methyl-D-erythritol kinase
LRVLGRRADGYHDLESLIVPIGLADRLEIRAAADPTEFQGLLLSLDVIGDESLVRGVPADDSNLVLRAAAALAERADTRGFADITLEKHVPVAGGLGGGSADAAASLRALNDLWACGLDEGELLAVAAQVGSDLPALMVGGAVVARGRGERVEPFSMPGLNLALATFDFGLSTADVFGWWDEDGEPSGPDPAGILRDAHRRATGDRPGDLKPFSELLHNDLEGPVVRRHPVVGEAKSLLLRAGGLGAVMSGSGPSLVAVLPFETTRLEGEPWMEVERVTGRPVILVGTEPVAPGR